MFGQGLNISSQNINNQGRNPGKFIPQRSDARSAETRSAIEVDRGGAAAQKAAATKQKKVKASTEMVQQRTSVLNPKELTSAAFMILGQQAAATARKRKEKMESGPSIGRVSKRRAGATSRHDSVNPAELIALRILAELAKKFADDMEPVERLKDQTILAQMVQDFFKRPVDKEWNEIQYQTMKSWQEVPPPYSLAQKLGIVTLNLETPEKAISRRLEEVLKDPHACVVVNSAVKHWNKLPRAEQ